MKTANITTRLIASLLFFILIMGCDTNTQEVKPRASGTPGEMLLVVDGPGWMREAITNKDWFNEDFPALPQSEKWFNASSIPYHLFNGHLRFIRTVLLFKHNPQSAKATLSLSHNRWANNQSVAEIVFPDTLSLFRLMEKELPALKRQIYEADLAGIAKVQAQAVNNDLIQKISKSHGITLTIPQGYRIKKDTVGFTWMEYETPKATFGLLVYSGKQGAPTHIEEFSGWRNDNMSGHVIGEREDSKMMTEDMMPLTTQPLTINGIYCKEIRGLWKMEGDFMGGPFVSVQIPTGLGTVVVEGFVYAPGHNKKAVLVRAIDAILRSAKI